MGVRIQVASMALQGMVEELAKGSPAVKDIVYNWRRWRNWESSPPIVALDEGTGVIVGFHAAVFQQRGIHVNSYYQLVDPSMQGQGLGGKMVDFLINLASQKHLLRLKFKCPVDSPGQLFWEGFGAFPFAQDGHQYWYDMDIASCTSIADAIAKWADRSKLEPVPAAEQLRAQEFGGELLLSAL